MAVVGRTVERDPDRPVERGGVARLERVAPGTADDPVTRTRFVVIRGEGVVARPAVEQVGARIARMVAREGMKESSAPTLPQSRVTSSPRWAPPGR
jgi:hypothetical protein